jgi:hypothetical protein
MHNTQVKCMLDSRKVRCDMRFTVLAFSVAAFALSAAAQHPSADWAGLSHIASGSEIRVVLTDGTTRRGPLQSATADSLVMNGAASQEALSRREIKLVQLKRRGHRGRNTLIGFSIGTGGGFAVGAAADAGNKGTLLPKAGKEVFTAVGAVVGVVVGVVLPTGGWRDIYRAP